MSKIFDRQFEGKQPKRINENLWFKQQQKMLLWMANTDYGRDLLCINKRHPKIIDFGKQHVTSLLDIKKVGKLYQVQKLSDFRVGAKWANIIRYRWSEFQQYAQVYYAQLPRLGFKLPILWPVAPVFGANYTHTDYFPDPDPETNTVDGDVKRESDAAWSTAHDTLDGTSALPSDASNDSPLCKFVNPNYDLHRAYTLFNTSDITSTDTIDAVTYNLFQNGKADGDNGDGNDYVTVVQVQGQNLGSNTNLVVGDYDQCGSALTNPTEGVDVGGRIDITASTNGAYNVFTLNATGRGWVARSGEAKPTGAPAGITYLGAREGHDIANSAPDGNTGWNIAFAETASTTSDPKLLVTHSAAAVVSISNLLLMGV